MDFGSDVNVLTKHTWESMGNPSLVWSHFKLRLSNKQKVFLIGQLKQVLLEVESMCILILYIFFII